MGEAIIGEYHDYFSMTWDNEEGWIIYLDGKRVSVEEFNALQEAED